MLVAVKKLCHPVNILLMATLLTLTACSSNRDENLQIRHHFEPNRIDTGPDKFDFTMTWFVPPAVLFGNETNSIIANMGLRTRPQSRPRLSIDNETKLKLEDIAIKRLENEMLKHDMCLKGYRISQTKWLERSIQFSGACLTIN